MDSRVISVLAYEVELEQRLERTEVRELSHDELDGITGGGTFTFDTMEQPDIDVYEDVEVLGPDVDLSSPEGGLY